MTVCCKTHQTYLPAKRHLIDRLHECEEFGERRKKLLKKMIHELEGMTMFQLRDELTYTQQLCVNLATNAHLEKKHTLSLNTVVDTTPPSTLRRADLTRLFGHDLTALPSLQKLITATVLIDALKRELKFRQPVKESSLQYVSDSSTTVVVDPNNVTAGGNTSKTESTGSISSFQSSSIITLESQKTTEQKTRQREGWCCW